MLFKTGLKIVLKIVVITLLKIDVTMFLTTGLTMLLKTGAFKSVRQLMLSKFTQARAVSQGQSGTGVHCRKACCPNGPRTNQPGADSPGAAAHLDLIQTSPRQTMCPGVLYARGGHPDRGGCYTQVEEPPPDMCVLRAWHLQHLHVQAPSDTHSQALLREQQRGARK